MDVDRFKSLLSDAAMASDPRSSGLLDYRDLQQLLGRVAAEASALLEECDAIGSRPIRNPAHSDSEPLQFREALNPTAQPPGWAHH